MPETAARLIQRTRRHVRDWPDRDTISASLSAGGTTVTVADSTIYAVNAPIEVDNETMIVRALASSTTLTVARGSYGSTAATHATAAPVLIRPAWYSVEILDAVNAAIQAAYPMIYQEVLDTSLTITSGTYEYAVPNMPGSYSGDSIPIPRIHSVELRDSSTTPYFPASAWSLRRGAAPLLKFRYLESAASGVRIHGYGPFPDLAVGDSLSSQWPKNFVQPLIEYAAAILLASGDMGRQRADSGMLDTREAAQRPGSSAAASQAAEGRFTRRLANACMAPMQPHVVVNG